MYLVSTWVGDHQNIFLVILFYFVYIKEGFSTVRYIYNLHHFLNLHSRMYSYSESLLKFSIQIEFLIIA